jgi:hypothetical protein
MKLIMIMILLLILIGVIGICFNTAHQDTAAQQLEILRKMMPKEDRYDKFVNPAMVRNIERTAAEHGRSFEEEARLTICAIGALNFNVPGADACLAEALTEGKKDTR